MKTLLQKALVIFLLLSVNSCTKETVHKTSSPVNQITQQISTFKIGDHYGGGIIFYLDSTKQHGLIADTADLPPAMWTEGSSVITGATSTAVGAGKKNTNKIVAAQGNTGSYAALECSKSNRNGYTDWFLPSKKELLLLYKKRAIVGGFAEYYYWSSSESDISQAYLEVFTYGGQSAYYKSFEADVRAIRAF